MLVWINGPFGGGKTATAYELARRVAGSVVCDPEHVGFGLHRAMPRALRGDFQDLRAWREGVFESLKARADAVAELLKPGTRLAFALFQLGFLAHHAFRKVLAKPSFGPDAPLAYMCPR